MMSKNLISPSFTKLKIKYHNQKLSSFGKSEDVKPQDTLVDEFKDERYEDKIKIPSSKLPLQRLSLKGETPRMADAAI